MLGVLASVVTVVFTISHSLALASLALVAVSGAVVAYKVLAYMLIQNQAHDDLRGRVMSFVVLFDAGIPRVGGLIAGLIAAQFTAPFALQVLALGCLISVLGVGLLAPQARRIG